MSDVPADMAVPECLLVDGAVVREHPAYAGYLAELDEKDYRRLYRFMALARRLDTQAVNLGRQGQLAVYPPSRGQEAAQVGAAYALAGQDWIVPSYRELGMALVRDVPPEALLHLWRGTWHGTYAPDAHHFGLVSIPVGTQALHAVGFAMGARLDEADLVVLACIGDGATSEGDVHEAMNFASVYDAPCVFFVQNNQYAISVPVARQMHGPTIAHRAIGYGMPGYRCDGNDVLATYAVTRRAVDRARAGHGPSLVEAVTYRTEAHTTSDDPRRYRPPGELETWQGRDPITRFSAYLEREGLLGEDVRAEVDQEAELYARRVRDAVFDAPHGDPLELFEHVYVDPPTALAEQRALLAHELGEGPGG
ncbi:MAG: pyruvate dehydrogenase (acetyl-transferring) E1 component subunit alpha [Egibacteraceae bacterium]